MTALEKMREWLNTYPGYDKLSGYHVDFTDQIPANAGVFPTGLEEVERHTDVLGNTTVRNQYNFGLYYVFEKTPGDDVGAAINADWVMDFQQWVQDQSIRGLAPVFGDDRRRESVKAQNGMLYDTDEGGTATYMVQLSVQFIKKYEVN